MRSANRRIAFVVPRYGRDVVGGAETLCRLMAEKLTEDGEQIEVLTTCAVDHFTWADHHPEGTTVENGVPVHRFPVNPARDADRFWALHVAIAVGQNVGYAEQLEWMGQSVWSPGLQHVVESADYDWVISVPYLFGTAFWAGVDRPERCIFVPCVHDEPHAWTDVVRHALTGVRGSLLNSSGEQRLFSRIAPKAEWRVVGVGVDDEPLPEASSVQAFCDARGIAPGYLLYAGRREAAKGLPLLFDCYAALREARADCPPLALMGAGDLAVPDAISAHVIELGYVPHEDRAAAYAAAGLLVHPSRLESLGMVMLEAWMAGTPAVVNGGSPVLVDHCRESGGGLWFSGSDDFVEVVAAVLDDSRLRSQLATSGREYVRDRFSWHAVLGRFRNALEDWS